MLSLPRCTPDSLAGQPRLLREVDPSVCRVSG